VAAWPERVGVGHHRLVFEPFVFSSTGNREADLLAVTALANRWYEAKIRACPHGWLWLHRRWKGVRPRS
jgi:lauroyl/myristoyl acyltransferase